MGVNVSDVDEIFCAAIEIASPDVRGDYVDRACGADAELKRRIDDLLGAHFGAGEFLDRPLAGDLLAAQGTIEAGPGTSIGPYRLLQQIGEGGMGVVFMAEQTRPIQRTVALKIVKPGMDTRQVIARFEAERQALAMMDHPNISKVLDAGTTDAGRPYFVMELVKGAPINKYCDDRKLPLRDRLKLLLPVCQAVQHAHQKGVIHRDLKPTNVLVADYDDRPAPKIIDFGVAKAIGQKLTDRTMFTEFGQVVGTFEYMSPEQAKFNQLDVDTRSDIYALGVLLYELLTGSTPFERGRLQIAALDEALRIIREEEPPKPSTRISESAALPAIAGNRHTEPARLTSLVRGELDWIVMKALEKDRNRRYETASSFALDLQRYLDEQPVQAGPPSLAYKIRKLARRNKRAVAVAAAAGFVIVAAIAAAAGSIGWAARGRMAHAALIKTEVDAALRDAEAAYNDERITDAVVAVNRAEGFMNSIEAAPELRDRVRSFKADFEMLQRLRDIESNHMAIGDLAEGEAACREAIRLRPESSFGYAALSQSLSLQGKYAEAETCALESIRLNPTGPFGHPYLGMVLARRGRFAEAAPYFRVGVERRPSNASWRCLLAFALLRSGNTAEAEREFEAANRNDKSFYLGSRTYANIFAERGQWWEAARMYAAAVHAKPGDLRTATRAAILALAAGDRKEYEAICEQMLKHYGQTTDKAAATRLCYACLIASPPGGDLNQLRRISDVAIVTNPAPSGLARNPVLEHFALALLAYRTGEWEGARQWSRQARLDAKELRSFEEESLSPWHALYDSRILVLEAMSLHQLDKPAEARQAYDEAFAVARKTFPYAPHFLGVGWFDWLMYELLRTEAASLMGVEEHGPADGPV